MELYNMFFHDLELIWQKKKKVLETCLKWFENTVHKIVFEQKKRETII